MTGLLLGKLPCSSFSNDSELRSLDTDSLTDACGTFLQLVIVSFCSLFLIVGIGLQKQREANEAANKAEEGRLQQQAADFHLSEKGGSVVGHLPSLQKA